MKADDRAGIGRRLRIGVPMAAIVALCTNMFAEAPTGMDAWEPIDLGGIPEIRSKHGVLSAVLVAAPGIVHVGAAEFAGKSYNGTYSGPVLRARPGDLVYIQLVNRLNEPTNLHFHGLRITPRGRGDNMDVQVPPGQSYTYEFRIPWDHPAGLFWYHDHVHGLAENHVMAGLGGSFLVDGFTKQVSGLEGVAQRLLVLKDYEPSACDGKELKSRLHCRILTVNGTDNLTISMRPDETQLWRISNQGANLIIHLAVPGLRLQIIGRDGLPTTFPQDTSTIDVLPASRMDVLVTAEAHVGQAQLIAAHVLTGSGSDLLVNRPLGTIEIEGDPVLNHTSATSPHQTDLRGHGVNARRTIAFTEDAEANHYFVDGKLYAHHRIDMRVPLGNLEEWTIQNRTQDFHEFHIHQLGFQVIEINNAEQGFSGFVDDVVVPEMGEVKLLLPFTDKEMLGTFMYHCHVLKHEDAGMMANIEVYDPNAPSVPHICRTTRD